MKWITQKEAIEAGKKNKKVVLNHSIFHWEQLATATIEQLLARIKMKGDFLHCEYCSLCKKYFMQNSFPQCRLCPAKGDPATTGNCCDNLWCKASRLWFKADIESGDFTKAAKKVYVFLKGLRQ